MASSLLAKLKKALKEETFLEVTDALGDDFDYDLIPRTRLNAVIKQRNELRETLKNGGVNDESTDDDDESHDDGDDKKARTSKNKQGKTVEDIIREKDKEKENAIKELEKKYAIASELKTYNPQDSDLVSSLIKTDKITMKDGNVEGLKEQLEEIKKNKPFLFKTEKKTPSGTGKNTENSDPEGSEKLDSSLDAIFGKGVE